MTYPPLVLRAKVLILSVFDPASGSVMPNACSRRRAGGDVRQVFSLLLVAAVFQDRGHRIHLRMARSAVAARAIDFLEDDAAFHNAKTRTAVFFGDQAGEPAGVGHGLDEALGIGPLLFALRPIFRTKTGAELAHGRSDLLLRVGVFKVHLYFFPSRSMRTNPSTATFSRRHPPDEAGQSRRRRY